ncbi:MAG: DUF2231 domain-containing protein [Nocardioidaceae bacterium]
MFDEIDGLPLHPLAVHAVVVLVPLSALLGVLYVVPRTRRWARMPFLLVALAAVPAVLVARQSGTELEGALTLGGEVADLVNEHQSRANLLVILVIAYAVVAVLAFVADRSRGLSKAMSQLVSVLVIVGAVAVAYQTYRVGDIGSRAVWDFVEFDQSS